CVRRPGDGAGSGSVTVGNPPQGVQAARRRPGSIHVRSSAAVGFRSLRWPSGGSSFPVAGSAYDVEAWQSERESLLVAVPRFRGVVGLEVVGGSAVGAERLQPACSFG